LSRYKIMHLAMHASGDDNPDDCCLAFYSPSQDVTGERLLRMKELSGLTMQSQLVVLSACETARGSELAGEGVQSLSQAVILNGARSVLATEWKVDDKATAEFVSGFYKRLSEGTTEGAALRSAKLSLLKGKTLAHPRYWAAFILLGDGLRGIHISPAPWWRNRITAYAVLAL